MRIFHSILLSLIGAALSCAPQLAFAAPGNYTAPLSATATNGINSFFDHTSPTYVSNGNMTKYDGNVWTSNVGITTCTTKLNCYDGHNGLDYNTLSVQGKDVLAAAPGVVRQVGWDSPTRPTQGFGFFVSLYHSAYNQTTLYGHTTSVQQIVHVGDVVTRSQKIAVSGSTGNSTAPHLHFSVYDGDVMATSAFTFSLDPQGWLGSGQDPWTRDKGYLFAVSPTSLSLFTTVDNETLTSSTTWLPGVYVINNTVTVASGTRLTILRDSVIKFETANSKLEVASGGTLDVEGTAASPVYFTSYHDDSVGGDTNGDATSTTPAPGDWDVIKVDSGASSTMAYAVVRYGGFGNTTAANIYNNGGTLTFSNSTSTKSGNYYAIEADSGTTTITSCDIGNEVYGLLVNSGSITTVSSTKFHDNSQNGIYLQGAGNLTLTHSTFSNNTYGAVFDYLHYGPTFTHSGNTFAAGSTGENGIVMQDALANDMTLTSDGLPYIVANSSGVTVPAGKTLTVSPGAIVKFEGTASILDVAGTLNARGSSTASSTYFTSMKDDSVGGDTNGNGASSGSAGDWDTVKFDSGASGTIAYAAVRYGGYSVGGRSQANLDNTGANLTVLSATSSNASTYGIYQGSGTTTITSANIHDQSYGIEVDGGTASATSSSFHNNSTDGVYNSTVANLNFEHNYWGSSDGPGTVGPGHGDHVSTNVDYTNWLSSWP